jgi:hypothetical protein
MNLRELLPKGKVSEETMQALEPVFKGGILYKEHYGEAESCLAGRRIFHLGSGADLLSTGYPLRKGGKVPQGHGGHEGKKGGHDCSFLAPGHLT